MSSWYLTEADLEENFHSEHAWSYLPVRIRDVNVSLCIARAYESFNQPPPKIIEKKRWYVPFVVYRRKNKVRMKLAVGMPYRLLPDYQCALPEMLLSAQEHNDFQLIHPDYVLEQGLLELESEFTDYPAEATASIVFVPFYSITVPWGSATSTVLVNGYNADILLERPPPGLPGSGSFGRVIMATGAYTGLVALITGTWLSLNSVFLSIALTIIAAAGIRKFVAWRLASE